ADHEGAVRRLTRDGSVSDVGKTSATPSLAASKDAVFAGGGLTAHVVVAASAGGAASPFLSVPDGGPDADLPGVHVLGADCDRLFGVRGDEGAFFWSPVASAAVAATAATFDDAEDVAADEGFVYVSRRKGG